MIELMAYLVPALTLCIIFLLFRVSNLKEKVDMCLKLQILQSEVLINLEKPVQQERLICGKSRLDDGIVCGVDR